MRALPVTTAGRITCGRAQKSRPVSISMPGCIPRSIFFRMNLLLPFRCAVRGLVVLQLCDMNTAASVQCQWWSGSGCAGSHDGCIPHALWAYTFYLDNRYWDYWLVDGILHTDATSLTRAFSVRCGFVIQGF